jgi:hypothetical protein
MQKNLPKPLLHLMLPLLWLHLLQLLPFRQYCLQQCRQSLQCQPP